MAANEFEETNRERKALALSRAIYRQMLDCVERMTEADWAQLAQFAMVNPPSSETIELVKAILKGKGPKD